MRNAINPMAAMPPTTPPTMAPTGVELLEAVCPPLLPPLSPPEDEVVEEMADEVEDRDDDWLGVAVVLDKFGGVARRVSSPAEAWHWRIEKTLPGLAVVE